jgi:hypothetical protein
MKKVVSLLLALSLVASPYPAFSSNNSSDNSAQANKSAHSNKASKTSDPWGPKEYFLMAAGTVSIGAIFLAQLASAGALFHVTHFIDDHPCKDRFSNSYYPRGLRDTALASGLMRIPFSFVLPIIGGIASGNSKGDGGAFCIIGTILTPVIAGHIMALYVGSLYLKNKEQIEGNCFYHPSWPDPAMDSLRNGFNVSLACELAPYAVAIVWGVGATIGQCLCACVVNPQESSDNQPAPRILPNQAWVDQNQAQERTEDSPQPAPGSNPFCGPNEAVVLRIASPVDSSQPAFPAADRSEASM